MKKFILTLLLVFTTLFSFAQREVEFARTYSLLLGVKNYKSEVTWGEVQECDILVQIEKSKVTIYSDRPQEYYVIDILSDESNYSKWLMSDPRGVKCWLYMGVTENNDYYMGIEYNDYVWFYMIKPQE
jgi:hypothetical protein